MSETTSILAIDPGYEHSAYVWLDMRRGFPPRLFGVDDTDNERLARQLSGFAELPTTGEGCHRPEILVVEQVQSYSNYIGRETLDTWFWAGRFVQAWGGRWAPLCRPTIKALLCGSAKAKDCDVRAALIDLYGPTKREAVGLKASPGPLYGLKSHLWSALAVGVAYLMQQRQAG